MGFFSFLTSKTDAFFEGLKSNATDRMIKKANKAGRDPEVTKIMDSMQKEKDEIDDLLDKIERS